MHYLERYRKAHEHNFHTLYPTAWKDGHYSPPFIPKVKTANGLTLFITNYLNWKGHRATRIAASGRLIDAGMTMESGIRLRGKKWIPGGTRRGSADISATINGRSVMMEIKIGSDKPSEDQLKEQAKEIQAGGIYVFIKTVEGFFEFYDSLKHRP